MTCETCGATLEPDATSCSVCGSAVSPADGTPGPAAAGGGAAHQPPPAAHHAPPVTHPSGLPGEVRNWAMAGHLSAFLGAFVALAVLGPLVVWLIRREVDGFSEQHAREALNFNLTLLLLIVAGVVVSIATLGIGLVVVIPVALVLGVLWIVLTIIAAMRAAEGREYHYPMTIRFVS